MTHPLHISGIANATVRPCAGSIPHSSPHVARSEGFPAATRNSSGGGMQWSIGGAVMRHCHIVLLHAAAAAVLLCLLMPGNTNNTLDIHESASVRFGRDRALKSDTAVADVPKGLQVWLYSLIGTDFPGAPACTALSFHTLQCMRVHLPCPVCTSHAPDASHHHRGCATSQAPQHFCSTGCGTTQVWDSGGSR